MVNVKKGGTQAKKKEKSTAAEKGYQIASKDGDDNMQGTTKQPATKRDKVATKTTEAPERKSRRGEKETKTEEKIAEVTEETSGKRTNGRKRKADEKESEDANEKESKSKKSKLAKESVADSEDQRSENDKEEVRPENESAATKTRKGRKTTEKKKVEETDKESEMQKAEETKGMKEPEDEDKVEEEPKTTKRGKIVPKANTEKVAEEKLEDAGAKNKADAEEMVVDIQDSKAKGVKRGTKNTKAGKEQNKGVRSKAEPAKTSEIDEETMKGANATTAKADVQNAKTGKEQKNKDVESVKNVEETAKGENAKENSEAKNDSKRKGGKTVVKNAKSATDDDTSEIEPPNKKARITSVVSHPSLRTAAGIVLTVGEGDTGQLGLGPDIQERGKPGKVEMPSDSVQVCAGGMHSVCLTVNGEVYTFGCNDEGSLGRPTKEEEDCMEPGKVDLPEKIVLVSAGDSHTAALSELGQVYIWGTFRDANGSIGILPGHGKLEKPEKVLPNVVVVKIASGCDHLVCLTADGDIYTMGAAEQGQLGRVAECFSVRGGRKGVELLLVPSMVKCSRRNQKFGDIWTGQYVTFAKAKDSGEIYAWGLNNYYQLGFPDMRNKFVPEKSSTFEKSKGWQEISSGQHHTVALDKDGLVYSLGRKEYGRLGLGSEDLEEKSEPTLVASLKDKKCVNVNCGSVVSFAVDEDGKVYGWGMGSSKQLAQGDDEEDIYEPKHITSKLLNDMRALMVSAGGQHTIFLAQGSS